MYPILQYLLFGTMSIIIMVLIGTMVKHRQTIKKIKQEKKELNHLWGNNMNQILEYVDVHKQHDSSGGNYSSIITPI